MLKEANFWSVLWCAEFSAARLGPDWFGLSHVRNEFAAKILPKHVSWSCISIRTWAMQALACLTGIVLNTNKNKIKMVLKLPWEDRLLNAYLLVLTLGLSLQGVQKKLLNVIWFYHTKAPFLGHPVVLSWCLAKVQREPLIMNGLTWWM